MVIILDKPVTLGDISPDEFPHVYVTNFYVNGPAVSVQVTYEFGRMRPPSAENQSGWNPTPVNMTRQFTLGADQLVPFFTSKPESVDESLWDLVETAIYAQIQKVDDRAQGKLGLGYEVSDANSAPSHNVAAAEQVAAATPDSAPADSSNTAEAPASENTSDTPTAP